MDQNKTHCVFGPIPSRRLGISLGVDLMPFKTCPMDCIYCECGKTTLLTAERKEYFPTEQAEKEIDDALAKRPDIDYITFSGTGEPTLHTGIGRIIEHIRKHHPDVKICLLTNSFFLSDPGLRKELLSVDLVIPSLDGSDAGELEKMNRPAPFDFDMLVDGIASLRKEMKGRMHLEIFLASGINDSISSAERFAVLVKKISPDKVQLNMLDRPGTEKDVGIPSPERLEKIRSVIASSGIVTECIGGRASRIREKKRLSVAECRRKILETIASRPCTVRDLADGLSLPEDMVSLELRQMEKEGLSAAESSPRGIYYRAK